jgi:hypothetical protein
LTLWRRSKIDPSGGVAPVERWATSIHDPPVEVQRLLYIRAGCCQSDGATSFDAAFTDDR